MINSIDEAIEKYNEFIESENATARELRANNDNSARYYEETAENDKKIVEWLTELQERREADRWIPVSEKLPEKDGYYLITRLNYGEAVTDKRSFNRRNGYGSFVCNNVTAWKEMPKPYESEGEE